MSQQHKYQLNLEWTGAGESGTQNYTSYSRDYLINGESKSADILGSSDPSFRGAKERYNPEEMLLASLSSCHMLWFLHLCAERGVIVKGYKDAPTGIMSTDSSGKGKMTLVTLKPVVTISKDSVPADIDEIHDEAHEFCFIAASVNFKITIEAYSKLEN